MNIPKAYILGDGLKLGNQLMRNKEAQALRKIGYDVYSPWEQKDINDKKEQTVASNNKLAERIVAKDMEAIREADFIVAEVDNDSVGTSVEIGAIMEFNWFRDNVEDIVNDNMIDDERKIIELSTFLKKYPRKRVEFHTTDIRHTDLEEKGMRRSFSINQFLHGACLAINKEGIKTFEQIEKELYNEWYG